MNSTSASSTYVGMTADVVSAFVSHNSVRTTDLPELIASVHSALKNLTNGLTEQVRKELHPPVSIKKSVTPDYIISLENGQKFKSLKRHLMNSYGMTPAEYRAKWGLPSDYPMVAPNYAKSRSELARSMGLGRKAKAEEAAPPAPAKRGRRVKEAA
jgi:predicted transcriptional regulator